MNKIIGLFQNADGEKRKAGEQLFQEGDQGTVMYVLRAGEVAIDVGGKTVENVSPGGLIGEMALLDNAPRSAGATALTDCDVVPIDQRRFLFLVQETPFFALEVMRVMARRLRAMNQSP